MSLKVIVVGFGVQGRKRKIHASVDYVASVDPFNQNADYADLRSVPLDSYDAALVCVPDAEKPWIIEYLVNHGKHLLVEKPLGISDLKEIERIEITAKENKIFCYTAYNHRFEPHFIRMKELIQSKKLGHIYSCRMFYGNGTARLVRESVWRDQGAGVLPDLGSHLLDTYLFWFGDKTRNFRIGATYRHENKSPDHVLIDSSNSDMHLQMEMTLCMWRNHFTCDVIGEYGSAHIESLCKWGPSKFTLRARKFPSGIPDEDSVVLVKDDPTWALEYSHFKSMIAQGATTCLEKDRWLQNKLEELSEQVS